MPQEARIRHLAEGLREALARLAEDPQVESSVRRMARVIAGAEEVPEAARALAAALVGVDPEFLAEGGAELLEALASRPPSAEAPASAPWVLLVESDMGVARAVEDALRSAHFQVRLLSGAEGVADALSRESYALLVVDIFLSDRDGRDLILEVSENPATAELPIVALSPPGERIALARSECLALGADSFLVRPQAADLIAGEAARLLEADGDRSHEREGTGMLRRARLDDRFRTRSLEAGGGVLVLLAFDAFRFLAEQKGMEAAERALGVVVDATRDLLQGVTDVGRWSTVHVILLLPGATEGEVAPRIHALVDELGSRDWSTAGAAALMERVTGAVVPTPPGAPLDDRVQVASVVRIGLSSEGTRILPPETEDDGKRTILIVEDDRMNRLLVAHKLRHAGFDLVEFEDGDRASAAIPTLDFDLAVLDVNLPGRDGFQLVREIRNGDQGRHRPILILSGMGSDADIVRGLELGADDYMLKPFSPLELTARVRRLLDGARAGTG